MPVEAVLQGECEPFCAYARRKGISHVICRVVALLKEAAWPRRTPVTFPRSKHATVCDLTQTQRFDHSEQQLLRLAVRCRYDSAFLNVATRVSQRALGDVVTDEALP